MRPRPHPLLVLLLLATSIACSRCAAPGGEEDAGTLRFREARVLGSTYDPELRATRVTARFVLTDRSGAPLPSLPASVFQALEDGVPATSESLTRASAGKSRLDVVLLLDCSKSMYDAPGSRPGTTAVADTKAAAQRFVERVQGASPDLCKFYYYRFADDVQEVPTLDEIPDAYDPRGGVGRWTALYHSVLELLARHDRPTIVLFSDGADSYSQNHGVAGLQPVATVVDAARVPVHAIGFGAVATEHDRNGVPAREALAALTAHGSLRMAPGLEAIDGAFASIADHLLATYTFDYVSPNLSGRHRLAMRVQAGELQGQSPELAFVASRAGAVRTYGEPETTPRWSELEPDLPLPFRGLPQGAPPERVRERLGPESASWAAQEGEPADRGRFTYHRGLGLVLRYEPTPRQDGRTTWGLSGARAWGGGQP